MNKKNKPFRKFIKGIGVLLVSALVVYLAVVLYINHTTPLLTEETQPDPDFMLDGEPLIEVIARWHIEENLEIEDINDQLPDHFELLVLNEDINANNSPDYAVISRDPELPKPATHLIDAGYTHTFRKMVVYENKNSSLRPILTIDNKAIRDEYDNRLINQIPAQYGYALVLEDYEHQELYEQSVQLIEIVMIDSEGRENSDEIVIYWDTKNATYKATNTFESP